MPSDTPAPPAPLGSAPETGALGLILPTFPQDRAVLPGAAALATLCRGAEAGGAGTLWACDHLFWHGPALEALTTLGVAAGATTGVAVGSCVLQLPLRHAASVAKESAALSHLSGGRLVLGVGVGTHPGEYAAAGVDFHSRGRLLDEGIDTLRRAWAPFPGERYVQLPREDSIPIWVGGSSEAALRRAARRGDGWIPLFLAPGEYAAALGRLDKEAEGVGRDPAGLARATVVFVSVGSARAEERGLSWMASLYGLPARSFARHLVAGTARQCASALVRFAEAGAQHVAVFVTSDDPLVQFEDLAGEFAGLTACQSGASGPPSTAGMVGADTAPRAPTTSRVRSDEGVSKSDDRRIKIGMWK